MNFLIAGLPMTQHADMLPQKETFASLALISHSFIVYIIWAFKNASSDDTCCTMDHGKGLYWAKTADCCMYSYCLLMYIQ